MPPHSMVDAIAMNAAAAGQFNGLGWRLGGPSATLHRLLDIWGRATFGKSETPRMRDMFVIPKLKSLGSRLRSSSSAKHPTHTTS